MRNFKIAFPRLNFLITRVSLYFNIFHIIAGITINISSGAIPLSASTRHMNLPEGWRANLRRQKTKNSEIKVLSGWNRNQSIWHSECRLKWRKSFPASESGEKELSPWANPDRQCQKGCWSIVDISMKYFRIVSPAQRTWLRRFNRTFTPDRFRQRILVQNQQVDRWRVETSFCVD